MCEVGATFYLSFCLIYLRIYKAKGIARDVTANGITLIVDLSSFFCRLAIFAVAGLLISATAGEYMKKSA